MTPSHEQHGLSKDKRCASPLGAGCQPASEWSSSGVSFSNQCSFSVSPINALFPVSDQCSFSSFSNQCMNVEYMPRWRVITPKHCAKGNIPLTAALVSNFTFVQSPVGRASSRTPRSLEPDSGDYLQVYIPCCRLVCRRCPAL